MNDQNIGHNIQPINMQKIVDYYSQDFVLDAIVKAAKDRECVGVFSDLSYDKRPNVVSFKSDVLNMVRNGISSFHLSVEHWTYPMQLSAENYDELRKGFDIVIDIDSKLSLEESRITAVLICDLLEKYGIKNWGAKFSGRRGFHICIPWEMLPKEINFNKTEKEYPKIPRAVSDFIRYSIKQALLKELRKLNKDIVFAGELDPFQFVEVEKDWGNRHLFRAPFSLNEKTWMVSLPLDYNELKNFDISRAKIENVKKYQAFFKECEENEAELLISDALDWYSMNTKVEQKKEVKKFVSTKVISEEYFPPCIKSIMGGLKDGKKRSLFTLINFLRNMNWTWEAVEAKLYEVNEKNMPKLPKQIIKSQLNWARQQNRLIKPANCNVDQYYKSIGIKCADDICNKVKNPIAYPFIELTKNKKKQQSIKKGLVCYICKKEFPDMKKLMGHKKRHSN